jgi:hypothetical protein
MEFTLVMGHVVSSSLGKHNPSFGVGLSLLHNPGLTT